MDNRLEPGHCWLSGKECFEIKAVYANDHPLAGHVLRVGNPMPEAWRVTLLLMDGKIMNITVHEECLETIPEHLNELWHLICEKEVFSYQHCKDADHTIDDDKAKSAYESTAKLIANNPPLGIVNMVRWMDVQ